MVRQEVPNFKNRVHFFGVAAHLMRQILVDDARKQRASKRGVIKIALNEAVLASDEKALDVVAVDNALISLAKVDERKCRAIELRYFAGLSIEETAEVLNIPVATLTRDLRMEEACCGGKLKVLNPIATKLNGHDSIADAGRASILETTQPFGCHQ